MADAGFLERLTGSAGDESVAAKQQIAAQIQKGGPMASMFFGLGQQAAGGLGTIGAGLLSGAGIGDGEKGAGFKANFNTGVVSAQDRINAAALGITPEEIKSRRETRKELSKEEFVDDGTHENRIKMAKRAIEIAQANGDTKGIARGLQVLKDLDREQVEFEKLQAESTTAKNRAADSSLVDAFDAEGNPLTGVMTKQNGRMGILIEDKDGDGEPDFIPFGDDLTRVDPTKTKNGESLDEALRKSMPKAERGKISSQITGALASIRKTRRVFSTLRDLTEKGGVEQVISKSGEVISGVDNLVRNIKGVATAAFSGGALKDLEPDPRRGWSGKQAWFDRSKDANDPIWDFLELPQEWRNASAAAQQHRASIMELAYMAARLAEPSNRGLSDNDIQNALTRIAGNTSNPQVIARRFSEIVSDSVLDVEDALDVWSQAFPGHSEADIESVLGGKALENLRVERSRLFADNGLTIDQNGRAVFQEEALLGDDVQPGEGTGQAPDLKFRKPDGTPMTDEETLDSVLGLTE